MADCTNHWHCDPSLAPHHCLGPNRAMPCPSCGQDPDSSPADLSISAYLSRMVAGTLTRPGREELAEMVRGMVEDVRLIRLALHADDCERATLMIDEVAARKGIL